MMKRLVAVAALIATTFGQGLIAQANTKPEENPFAGRLVKTDANSAVYYIGPDQKRHAFPNAKIYFSWYSDFRRVEVIDDFEMAMYPLGANVLYKPGSRLVKISDVSEVYAVEPGGVLRNIPSEEVAIALYGKNWSKRVDDLDISFFFDYDIGGVIDVIDEKPLYPRGTPVTIDSDHFIVDKTASGRFWLRPITVQAWEQNGFNSMEVESLEPSWRELYIIGLPILSPEAGYACPACTKLGLSEPTFNVQESPNGRYAVSVADGWGLSFFSVDTAVASDVLLTTESIDETAARASVVRWPKQEGQRLDEFVQNRLSDLWGQDNARQYAALASRDRIGAYDVVAIIADNETDRTMSWTRFVGTTDAWYELSFRAPFVVFSQYREHAQQFLNTFTVNEAVPE